MPPGAKSVPRHIAIIMDGNGRWAKAQGLPRIKGHEKGARAARECVEGCAELKVEYLTLYAFSAENWQRPKSEVFALMKLLEKFLKEKTPELIEKNVQALAGVLRLARALRRSDVNTCEGMRAEKSADAIILHVPGLVDSVETAARLAAGKHLLETYIAKPIILKPAIKTETVVALIHEFQEHRPIAAASD